MKRIARKWQRRAHQMRVGCGGPSYFAKVEEERRVADFAATSVGIHRRELWRFNSKSGLHAIAREMGIRVPELLHAPSPPELIAWDALPDAFVSKPDLGARGNGVRVLTRHEDMYFDAISKATWTIEDLVADYRRLAASGRTSTNVLIEAPVGGGHFIPHDWKFYAFHGEVALVLQVDRNHGHARYCYFDTKWRPAKRVHYTDRNNRSLSPPQRPTELLEAARNLSASLPIPFVRVHLYEDETGPLLGELTPWPGDNLFRPKWDRAMGSAWEEAEADLRLTKRWYAQEFRAPE